ncbi:phytanoyl-CoA dioxygenase domain-containing protein 1-like [Daphnia carinata]|uniref:phytanoyl-CoA dioxygenase domain-containing protein 1-like n=1 Tax=Daphnia carinata TaxID=120202 RepID=UPI002580ED67|nr:phytanoyl-CoA dioxygenase domain-containing protein 1-like [Daphnia carinata]
MGFLNKNQIEQFHNDGYLIINNFLSDEDVASLRKAIATIIDDFQPDQHRSIFTTTDTPKQARDTYFLESGDKIRYFFEEGALNENGELIVEKDRSLNKIGHALHWLNPDFKRVTFSNEVKGTLKDIGFKDPAIVQSMYIFKQPGIGGEVSPHQDSTFLHTEPMKIVGMWFALEDVTLENGCLWFIPGSHKEGISRRFIRNPDESSPNLTIYTDPNPDYDETKFIPGPVPKGSMVLIHGEVVHKSERNLSQNSRHIYTFHVIERENTTYSSDNWLQPTEKLPFPGVFDN